MKIYYFLRDDSDSRWDDMELKAFLEHENVSCGNNGETQSSFTQIEHISVHLIKGSNFHSRTFRIDFGKDSSIGSFSKTPKDLIKSETNNATSYSSASKQVTKEEYKCLRRKIFEIYQQEMFLDLEKLENDQPTENQ